MKPSTMKISTYFNIGIGVSFLVIATVLVIIINHQQREQAVAEAEEKAILILNRNLAIHKYFNGVHQPKPFVSDRCPSYTARQIDSHFKSFDSGDFYFKESAINARNARYEADEYEKDFIRRLNGDKGITSHSDIHPINGKPYLVVLRRGTVFEKECLGCHGDPERAPAGLIKAYGSKKGFHHKEGEVASALSVRIPLGVAYGGANRFSLGLSALLIFIFMLLFGAQLWVNKRILLRQIYALRDKALRIAADERNLDEVISVRFGREFQEMAEAFNAMSQALRKNRDHLEELIRERTIELSTTNRRLQDEVVKRKQTEEVLHESERRQRTLISNLPGIVYRCRNDQGLAMEFISNGCKNLTGYPSSDLVDNAVLSYGDLIVPEDREYVRFEIRSALEEKGPYQLTYRIRTASGEVRWVWEQGTGVWNMAGKLLALEGFITDITERKTAEEELRKAHGELEKANLDLERLAREDGLTGIANRRHFNETLENEVRRACRAGDFLSLILCDIDYFKLYNDHYGHIAGDSCLKAVGKVLQRVFRRTGELPARYGGEEFAVILPDVPPDQAAKLAETLRLEMLSEAVPHAASDVSEYVTLSIGVTGARVTMDMKAEWLTHEADKALYVSKRNGRNLVTCNAFDETGS